MPDRPPTDPGLTGAILGIAGAAAVIVMLKADGIPLARRAKQGMASLLFGAIGGWTASWLIGVDVAVYAISGLAAWGAAQIEPHAVESIINRVRQMGGLPPMGEPEKPQPLDPTPRDRNGNPKQ